MNPQEKLPPPQGLEECVDRFLSREYFFQSDVRAPFTKIKLNRLAFAWLKFCHWLEGEALQGRHSSEIYDVFGSSNKAPRQSLRNYLGKDLKLLVSKNTNPYTIMVGAWEGDIFHGVSTYAEESHEFPSSAGILMLA